MAIDTYLIQNNKLQTLNLVDVCLTQDLLRLLAGTIETSMSLINVDLSGNSLKNGGAREAAKIICRNKSIGKINLSNN